MKWSSGILYNIVCNDVNIFLYNTFLIIIRIFGLLIYDDNDLCECGTFECPTDNIFSMVSVL